MKVGAAAKGKLGFVTPVTDGGSGLGIERPLPNTGTLHLLSAGTPGRCCSPRWTPMTPTRPATRPRPGRSSRDAPTNTCSTSASSGPSLPEGAGLVRNGEALLGRVPLFSDGSGNFSDNNSPYESALTTLYRNGELVYQSIYPFDCFYVADNARADYRLTAPVTRGAAADVSTSMTASWRFSAYADGITEIPTSVVRFTPALSLDNTGRARAKVRVPVTVEGAAEGRNLKSLKVWVSDDKGAHWEKTAVRDGGWRSPTPRRAAPSRSRRRRPTARATPSPRRSSTPT